MVAELSIGSVLSAAPATAADISAPPPRRSLRSVPPRTRAPSIVHVHVSGSAGTSMCHWARAQGWRTPSYNCLLQCKGQGDWLAPWLGNECRDGRSCAGLERRVQRVDFAEVETGAPHWLGCPGIRYTFLMVDPVKRVLSYAHRHCEHKGRLNARCDAAETLRRWLDIPLLLLPPRQLPNWARDGADTPWAHHPRPPADFPWRGGNRVSFPGSELEQNETDGGDAFFGTPAVSNYNVRMLSSWPVFFAPLASMGEDELAAAKRRLETFAFAAALPLDEARAAGLNATLNGTGALPRAHFSGRDRKLSKTIREEIERTPKSVRAMLEYHNRLDLELYAWLKKRVPAN